MKHVLKLEELALFVLALISFNQLDYAWWLFFALFLLPDLSGLGYMENSRIGAISYNFFHHKATALAIYLIGYSINNPILLMAGTILFAHSTLDRVFGYGLKFSDSSDHTHLGMIGKAAKAQAKT